MSGLVRVAVNPDGIPDELRALDQWVAWRTEWRADKRTGELQPTKLPINARTGGNAATDNPATWSRFETAVEAAHQYDGIGFVFAASDPFFGVDLDACRDPNTGAISPWAQAIIMTFDTYTELSPSGTGVKLFGRGALPEGAWHKKLIAGAPAIEGKSAAVEMFDRLKYFTMTGVTPEDHS